MEIFGILWVIGWIVYCVRDLPWSESNAAHFGLMFVAWPIVMGVDAYDMMDNQQRELIKRLRIRLIKEEDERSEVHLKLLSLPKYNSPDVEDADAPSDAQYVRADDYLQILHDSNLTWYSELLKERDDDLGWRENFK